MTRRLLPVALTALPFLLGAKRAKPDAIEPIDPAAAIADLQIETSVELIDPGEQPRTVIAYRPKIGARADYEVTVGMDMGMSIVLPDGNAQSIPLGGMMPPISTVARNTVGEPLASGHIPVRVEFLDFRVDGEASPEVSAALLAGMSGMQGMKFDMLIDPATGRPVQVDLSGGESPELASALQSMMDQYVDRVVQFPSEPVGVGATWKIAMDMSMSGLDMSGTETVTVRDISKNKVEVDLVLDPKLGEGGMNLPGLPPGAVVDVTEFSGTGLGTMTINLQDLTSVGLMTIDMKLAMKMGIPGQGDAAMTMTLKEVLDTHRVK